MSNLLPFLLLSTLALAGILHPPGAKAQTPGGEPRSWSTDTLTHLHARYRIDGLEERDFGPEAFWNVLMPVIDRSEGLVAEEVGASVQGRPLRVVRYGDGPTTVLLWSQMHGDESTATMALADLFHFFAAAPEHPLAQRLSEDLTVVALPMLNPDGAAVFQRRNAQGIDVNRDAQQRATPEARTLKRMQERFQPDFGFNLHDQDVRTRVAESNRGAAIGLLAPEFDAAGSENAVRTRAKQVAVLFRQAVEPLVGGHITRYDATYMSRSFGDNMQRWGVSTVLVESGGWPDDPEKQFLRKVNFVGLLGALEAIATGRYQETDASAYDDLPENGRDVYDLLVRGGEVVAPGMAPYRADLAVNYDRPLRRTGGRVVELGALAEGARDTLDARGLFVHPESSTLKDSPQGKLPWDGMPARFTLRRGASDSSEAVWVVEDGGAPRRPTGWNENE